MSFLAGIFNKATAPASIAQPTAAPPAGGPATTQHQPANTNMKAGGNPSNPLDPVLSMLIPSAEILAERQKQQEQINAPLFDFDQAKLQETVSKTDFLSGVNQEDMQKALSGDAQSLINVINTAVRQGMMTNIQVSKGFVEQGVTKGLSKVDNQLDSRMQTYQLKQHNSENPAIQHPVGKAMLTGLTEQIRTANPNMPATEIAKQAEKVLLDFAQYAMTGAAPKDDATNKAPSAFDFSDMLKPGAS